MPEYRSTELKSGHRNYSCITAATSCKFMHKALDFVPQVLPEVVIANAKKVRERLDKDSSDSFKIH